MSIRVGVTTKLLQRNQTNLIQRGTNHKSEESIRAKEVRNLPKTITKFWKGNRCFYKISFRKLTDFLNWTRNILVPCCMTCSAPMSGFCRGGGRWMEGVGACNPYFLPCQIVIFYSRHNGKRKGGVAKLEWFIPDPDQNLFLSGFRIRLGFLNS